MPESGYECACGKWHDFGAYPTAQMAMGHDLTHTCSECGRRDVVADFECIEMGEGPEK